MQASNLLAKFIANNLDELNEKQLKQLVNLLQKIILKEGGVCEDCKNTMDRKH